MFASHRPLKSCEEWVVFLPGVSPGLYCTSDGMGPTSQPTILPTSREISPISTPPPPILTSSPAKVKSRVYGNWTGNSLTMYWAQGSGFFFIKMCQTFVVFFIHVIFSWQIFTKKDFFKFDKNVIFFECQSSEFASMRPSIRMRAYLLRS